MTWFPFGPDFVFGPRIAPWKRLSRANEGGRQGTAAHLTVDPSDPAIVYVVERPWSGGAAALRSHDAGRSWSPISDDLQRANWRVDPNCVGVNPARPEAIYLGTFDERTVHFSPDRGAHWVRRVAVPRGVRTIVVDPRGAQDPISTVLLVGTEDGLLVSPDDGDTWPAQPLTGDVWSVVVNPGPSDNEGIYAAVKSTGIWKTTGPADTGTWTNLNDGVDLPAAGTFDEVLLAAVPQNPDRIYALFKRGNASLGLYRLRADSKWVLIQDQGLPTFPDGTRCFDFVVAPNSPGTGENDILFIASKGGIRSVDCGRTWVGESFGFHVDQHAFGFGPVANGFPLVYLGSDGGLCGGTEMADPAFVWNTKFDDNVDLNQGETTTVRGAPENLNHGRQVLALTGFAADATLPTFACTTAADTGVQTGTGALGWRGIRDDDGAGVAFARRPDGGVTIWANTGIMADGRWPGMRAEQFTDFGDRTEWPGYPTLVESGSMLEITTAGVVAGGQWITGVVTRDPLTATRTGISAGADREVPVDSMAGIFAGRMVIVGLDNDAGGAERVAVKTVAADRFTADFTNAHPAGVTVSGEHASVCRVGHDGRGRRISQIVGDFNQQIVSIATSPANPDLLYCAALGGDRLFRTDGTPITTAVDWTRITAGAPNVPHVSAIAIGPRDTVHVLLLWRETTGSGATAITSPLFQIEADQWVHRACENMPSDESFGALVADPLDEEVLYASSGGRVFRLDFQKTSSTWRWTDISDGLSGNVVHTLWVGNVAPADRAPLVLLRAATLNRGVWEKDVSPGAAYPAPDLYVRDHVLDTGRLTPSPEGLPDPFRADTQVWHYQCADIKIDSAQRTAGGDEFFQSGALAEALPIDHTQFDQLQDNSQTVRSGAQALVHVQVQNRSAAPAAVQVWALFTSAAAGLPDLDARQDGSRFDFWRQFDDVAGTIVPALPADSAWRAAGEPITLTGLDVAHPAVASWRWHPPIPGQNDPGHFCIIAFVQSLQRPLDRSSVSADATTIMNKQVGQKNLHILPPLDAGNAPGGSGSGGGSNPIGEFIDWVREHIRLHNPGASVRSATLVLDARALPPELRASLRLPAGVRPGAKSASAPSAAGGIFRLIFRIFRWVGTLIVGVLRLILGQSPLAIDSLRTYTAAPSGRLEIRDVPIAARGFVQAELRIERRGPTEPGRRYPVDVQQWSKEGLLGGSTYVVVVGGEGKPGRRSPKGEEPANEGDGITQRERLATPPWIRPLLRQRLREHRSGGQ